MLEMEIIEPKILEMELTGQVPSTIGGDIPININIENGDGDNSLQQTIESTSWDAKNEAVKYYITEEIGTEDNPDLKIVHDGDTIIVGTFGKSSFMQNGKGQTVGNKTHVEGSKCIAFENNSHAEGNETFAGGKHSHAEGNTTSALGNASHTEGLLTISAGVGSHSEGIRSLALGDYSHAEGVDTRAEVQYSHSEGSNTVASGDTSHAEGDWTTASGTYSHSEGNHTSAENDCAHAEGYWTVASGVYSHAEGNSTVASGNFSHTEGSNTHAESVGSHAEGVDTFASNDCTHAEGYQTKANGIYSHAEGYGTVAERPFSHVQGAFNLIDKNKEFLHIVGNGMSENDRSNAYTLDWNGNGVYKGDLKINGNRKVATTSQNNNFSVSQTINGALTVNGNIVQNGESYETHAEQLYTEKDEIITRDGAVGGLSENQLTGIRAKKYDGVNDGQLGFDADGTARVGDVGDTQPLLTRDEAENLVEGQVLVWDGTKLRAVGSSEYTKNAVEKVEYNSTDGSLRGRVYVVDHTNTQTTKELRITSNADSIPLRNPNGNIYVNNPKLDLECANKKYVDGLVGNINNVLATLVTIDEEAE